MVEDIDRRQSPFSLRAVVTALATVTVVVLVVVFAAYHTCSFGGCPEIDQVHGYVADEASVVLDRNGDEVGKLFHVNRVVVELDSLPDHIIHAVLATEDQDFYDHGGVDWSRAVGALWQNLRSGNIQEGFSTITMQVARNVFPERLPVQERTLNRKLSEIKVARGLERRYTKDEILSLYLNQIYFGSGAWGIQAAAQEYFGKSATDLTLAEASLLAGLPQAPSDLNPRRDMEAALERRRTVLRRMQSEGFISAEEAAEVNGSQPELSRSRVETPDRAAYFMEHVRKILEGRFGDRIYTGGYTIHTTLNLETQAVAERELQEQLQGIESGRYGPFPHPTYGAVMADSTRAEGGSTTPYLQGSLIVMAASSGEVLALIGGRDFDQSKFNRAVQSRRQPGSAFKPIVYAAALQSGRPPTALLQDTPYHVVRDGREWSPRNYDGGYAGEITMREALVQSKNVATIRLAEQVGLGRVINMARSLGIEGDIPHYPSIAIGAAEVTLLELVTSYATLATLGERPEPRFVTRVTDRNDNVVWEIPRQSRRVLDADVAFLTVDLMRDVVDRGTGAAVRSAGFYAPAAGKTGTTNESADVWFVGFTPEIVTGVWIGMDDPQRIMSRATGGRLAAPVWGRIMRRVASGQSAWSSPPGVETHLVDTRGNVVGTNCPTSGEVREEYFLTGTVSTHDCRDYLMAYGDSAYADSIYDDDDSWWNRLRSRVFGDERDQRARTDTMRMGRDSLRTPHDTIIMGPPRDTVRMRPSPPDTTPRPWPEEDTILGTPVRDTVRDAVGRDTTPAPPDTSRGGGGTDADSTDTRTQKKEA